jgi:hypothetical protein
LASITCNQDFRPDFMAASAKISSSSKKRTTEMMTKIVLFSLIKDVIFLFFDTLFPRTVALKQHVYVKYLEHIEEDYTFDESEPFIIVTKGPDSKGLVAVSP